MKHKVTIGLGNNLYGMKRDMYEEGEKDEFKMPFARDESVRLTTDDVPSIQTNYDACLNYYSFIMPDHDVNISLTRHNDMMRDPNSYAPSPISDNNTNFMGMGFMNKTPNEVSNNTPVMPKNFCSFCGTKVSDASQKFCMNCGGKL